MVTSLDSPGFQQLPRITHVERASPVPTCTASSATTTWCQRAGQGSHHSLTRKRPRQRAWVRHVTKRYRGWSMHHVIVGHCFPISLHAWAEHPLADEVHGSNHKDCKDHTNNGTYCVVGLWCRLLRCI